MKLFGYRIALTGALFAAGCASAPRAGEDGKVSVAKVQVRQIATACEQYRVEKGAPPESLQQLVPQYLELIANDPWGNKFVYPAAPGTCEIASLGPDGQRGTDDDLSSKGEAPTAYTK